MVTQFLRITRQSQVSEHTPYFRLNACERVSLFHGYVAKMTIIYIRLITTFSPHGTEIEITGDDWVSSSPETIEPSYSWDTETLKYGDLYFGRFQKKGGAKGSKQMDIMIPSIGSFQ